MLYNHSGPLLRWFANAETDYGTELVAGGTRQNVERQPIWQAYHKYPDTHRVGWPHADHIIRDAESWEILGPPVSVCLESPHSREAVAEMIQNYRAKKHGQTSSPSFRIWDLNIPTSATANTPGGCGRTGCSVSTRDISSANRIWGTRFDDFTAVPDAASAACSSKPGPLV